MLIIHFYPHKISHVHIIQGLITHSYTSDHLMCAPVHVRTHMHLKLLPDKLPTIYYELGIALHETSRPSANSSLMHASALAYPIQIFLQYFS